MLYDYICVLADTPVARRNRRSRAIVDVDQGARLKRFSNKLRRE